MKLSVERKPKSLAVLDITADDQEFADALQIAFRKISKDVQLPGFRKGKAPRGMIERMYGRDVFLREAADEIMEKLYRDALAQEQLVPVGDPDVEITQMEPVGFVVTVPVYPSIEIDDYSVVRAEPVDAAVTDEDVQEVLDRLQTSQAEWVDVAGNEERKPTEGDQVTVDYEVKEGDEPFQEPVTDAVFVIGETNLLAQLQERLEDLAVGQTETFDLVFEEGDESVDPAVRGKALTYTMTVKSLKQRDLPVLDDEFAKQAANVESFEDLKNQIRTDVHQGKTNEGRTGVVNQIIDEIGNKSTIDLPDVMVNEEVDHRLNKLKEDLQRSGTPYEAYLRVQNQTEEQLREELYPEAAKRLRNSMVLQEITKAEDIEITEDDIEAEIMRVTGPLPSGETDEEQTQAARMAEFYKSDYFRNMLRNELLERKLTDRLIEIATEGRGAVLNGWEPDPNAAMLQQQGVSARSTPDDAADEAAAEMVASDEAFDVEGEIVEPGTEPQDEADDENAAVAETASSGKWPAGGEGESWVKAQGDEVPDGFPIKGKANSKIYHPQESPFYENTSAEIYFATAEAAEASGYRLPKSMQS